jgi:hypothetical protein
LAALQAQTVPKVTLSNSIEFPESIAINHRAPSHLRISSHKPTGQPPKCFLKASF